VNSKSINNNMSTSSSVQDLVPVIATDNAAIPRSTATPKHVAFMLPEIDSSDNSVSAVSNDMSYSDTSSDTNSSNSYSYSYNSNSMSDSSANMSSTIDSNIGSSNTSSSSSNSDSSFNSGASNVGGMSYGTSSSGSMSDTSSGWSEVSTTTIVYVHIRVYCNVYVVSATYYT
jgi:hypothetical protein